MCHCRFESYRTPSVVFQGFGKGIWIISKSEPMTSFQKKIRYRGHVGTTGTLTDLAWHTQQKNYVTRWRGPRAKVRHWAGETKATGEVRACEDAHGLKTVLAWVKMESNGQKGSQRAELWHPSVRVPNNQSRAIPES